MMTRSHGTATAKRPAAWPVWGEKLAAVLAELKEDQYLIVSTKLGRRFVQFAALGAYGLRSETVSNAYLEAAERLDDAQVAALLAAGWHAPTGTPEESTPDNDPDGSSNFYRDDAAPVPFDAVADLAVLTFAGILRVPHPDCLRYSAFEAVGEGSRPLDLPALGLKLADPDEGLAPSLADEVLETIREATGLEHLEYDDDGDIVVGYGNATVLIRPIEAVSIIRMHALLIDEVEKSTKLLERLNLLNAQGKLVRFFYSNDSVYAVTELVAAPFVKAHLARTFEHCCHVADETATQLRAEFGGEGDLAAPPPGDLLH